MNNLCIDIKNLNKYFGEHHVVKDFSLQVAKGEIYGFLGPNGSGKTTSIRMMCGLITPDSGEGSCLGMDIFTQREKIKKKDRLYDPVFLNVGKFNHPGKLTFYRAVV